MTTYPGGLRRPDTSQYCAFASRSSADPGKLFLATVKNEASGSKQAREVAFFPADSSCKLSKSGYTMVPG